MKHNSFSKITALALVLVMCAACGNTPAPSSSSTAPADGTDATSSSSTPTGDPVAIEIFSHKTETTELLNQIIANYEAKTPGVKITQTQIPDSRTVLYSRMSAGDVPDIVGVFPNESDFRMQVEAGYYMDITGDSVLANIDSAFLKDIKVDNKDYSVPLTLNGWGIFYNKTKFNELKLSPPTTWSDFEKLCADIKAAKLIPLATSFKEGWTTGHIGETLMVNIAGVEEARKIFSDPSVKLADNANFQKLISRLDFFEANSQPDSISTDYGTAAAIFSRGEALMMPQGIWALGMFQQAGMTDEIGMFPVPNDAGKGMIQYGIDMSFAVSATTKNPDEVKAFVSYLASPETAQFLANSEKSPSTIKGVTSTCVETQGVTSMLFEAGRSQPWFHFEWAPGTDGQWGSEVSAYFVQKDKNAFTSNLSTLFGK